MNKKIDKVIGILKNKYVHNGTVSEKHFVDIASKYDTSILDMIRIQELLYEDGIDIKTSDNDSENDKIKIIKNHEYSQHICLFSFSLFWKLLTIMVFLLLIQ